MGTYNATVTNGTGIKKEHCVAHPGDLQSIGTGVDQQVRLWRRPDRVALFTVESASVDGRGQVRLGRGGRGRLDGGDRISVRVDAQVVDPGRTSEQAEVDGEFVERLIVGEKNVLAVIAPHGGAIEEHTDGQALRVARRLRALAPWVWVCKGWGLNDDAFERWHITSVDISPESFPLLKRMIREPFTHAISFHGFDLSKEPGADVRIGGRAQDDVKECARRAIEAALGGTGWVVVLDREGDPFPALDRRNIVNRLAPVAGGLQIEQSLRARKQLGAEIADAVASALPLVAHE
ncbi:MAG TPA: poly-gamma-glutamate hydrolase family protein [Acidimicrobiales bacterium]|nr:poly-gamma-glutamate hydrolase family protein [Acidimicrobiales bacterium]